MKEESIVASKHVIDHMRSRNQCHVLSKQTRISGFDLTLQTWFVSFPNKDKSETDVNAGHQGWRRRKFFALDHLK